MKKVIALLLASNFILYGCSSKSAIEINSENEIQTESQTTTVISSNELKESIVTTKCELTETSTQSENTEILSQDAPEDGQLVRILDYIPDAVIDLRYATTNNFTGTIIYDSTEAYLCYGTVKKLILVQEELRKKGYRILIWDAYRSVEAQWKLWETYPNSTYVANPNNGLTSHSRGSTVDISIAYEDGSPVEMPSEFDEFTLIADRNYSDVSENVAANSMMLEEIMYRNGFSGYAGEWWDYSDTEQYDLIPINYADTYLSDLLSKSNYQYNDISDSEQLIVVESDGYNCNVCLYEKTSDSWEQVSSVPGYVGKNGVADNKVEGDMCTPSGLYNLGFGFGFEEIDTSIEYRIINDDCYWVDDLSSEYYNQWVQTKETAWNSAEHMIDYPDSYYYGIVINYNMNPIISGKGSAIFLHCSTGNYTAGCVAVPKESMKDILQWVDSDLNPIILIV